jgi:hypothetical protein
VQAVGGVLVLTCVAVLQFRGQPRPYAPSCRRERDALTRAARKFDGLSIEVD